jgi:hypothetical protein
VIDPTDGVVADLDLHAEGAAAVDALSGTLVATVDSFSLDLGQVDTTADNGTGLISFADAEALSVTLTGVDLWAGVGGGLTDNDGDSDNDTLTIKERFEDDTVASGSFGFVGEILGSLSVVAIKDLKLDDNPDRSVTADDVDYLGVLGTGLAAELVGLESVLEFHAWDGTLKLNKATDNDGNDLTTPDKLDWDSLETSGLTLPDLDIDEALDLHVDGSVALDALSGTLVATVTNFSLDMGQVSTTADNGTGLISLTDAEAISVVLTGVEVWAGVGGSLNDVDGDSGNDTLTIKDRFEDDTVANGSLGFRGSLTSMSLVMIDDGTNSYLGVATAADALSADLVGLESVLAFHAWDATLKLNKVTPTTADKIDWDSLATSGLPLANLDIDEALDLHVDGSVALDALSGILVATVDDFSLDMGQVSTTADNGTGLISFTDADAVSMTLTGVEVWAGVGGSLNDVDGDSDNDTLSIKDRYSDDEVSNGSLGFRGSLTSMSLVTINDGTNSYLGVETAADALSADLVGLESVLAFHAWDATLKLNKVTPTTADKIDWDSLATSGLPLANLDIDEALDLHVDGSVALDALSGILVATVDDFSLDMGQVSTTADNGTGLISFTDADAVSMTLTGVEVWAGVGGSLNDVDGDSGNGGLSIKDRYSDDEVDNGTLGFRGSLTSMSLVTINDGTNSYLGLATAQDALSADLIGLESVLEFHAWDATLKLNKVTPATADKIDWDSLATSGLPLASLDIDEGLDLHVDGSVAVNVLDGIVVATVDDFSLDMGQVSTTADNGTGLISFTDAEALSVVLTGVDVWAGVGGSLDDVDGDSDNDTLSIKDRYSDDEVVNGTLGFRGSVTSMSLVTINDGVNSYMGILTTGLAADLVGLEAILDLHAWDVTLKLNKVTPETADKLDWDSLATSGLTLPSLDIDEGVNLNAQGNLAFSILGLVTGTASNVPAPAALAGPALAEQQLASVGSGSIEFTSADVDTNNPNLGNAGVLEDADIVSISLLGTDFFVGINGPGLDGTREAVEPVPDDAIGFSILDASIKLAIVTPAGLAPTDKTRYLGLETSLGTADLVGIDDLTFTVGPALLLVNQATDAAGAQVTDPNLRVDWSNATTVPDTATNLLPDFDPELTNDVALLIQGTVTVDVFGFLSGTGSFSLKQATGSFAITDANTNTSTQLSDVDFLAVGFEIASASIDVGGVGLSLTDLKVAMLMVTDAVPATPIKYTALKAEVGDASLDGIDGIELSVVSLAVVINRTSDAINTNTVLDFVDSPENADDNGIALTVTVDTGPSNSVDLDIDGDEGDLLAVSGGVELDLFGFLTLSGGIAFKKATGDFFITDPIGETTTKLDNVSFLSIGTKVDSASINVGDISLVMTGLDVAVVIVTDPATTFQYTVVKADVTSASLDGIPGINLQIDTLAIQINKTSDPANPNTVLDFFDTPDFAADDEIDLPLNVATGPDSSVDIDIDGNEGELLQVAGGLTLDILGFVYLSGDFAIKKATATVDISNGDVGVSVDMLTIGASGVDAFVGINGPADNAGAIGLSLQNVDFALALLSVNEPTMPLDLRTFTALSASVGGAGIVGIEDLDLSVSNLTLAINQGSGTLDGSPSTDVVEFDATPVVVSIGPSDSITFDFDGAQGPLLEAAGDINLNLFEVVTVDASFALRKQTADVDVNGNGVFSTSEGDLDDASLLTFGLSVTDFFAGIPGGVGFSLASGQIVIATIGPNPVTSPGDNRSFLAIKSELADATLAGLPPDLVIVGTRLQVDLNTASGTLPSTPTPLDWTDSIDLTPANETFVPETVSIDVGGNPVEFDFQGDFTRIGGELTLDAFGLVTATASFEMVKQTVDVDVDGDGEFNVSGNTGDLDDATLLTLELTISDFFAGVPGEPGPEDDIGLAVSSGQLILASIKADPTVVPADDRGFTALISSISGAEFVGIPDLIIIANSLNVELNTSSGTVPPPVLDWTVSVNLDADSDAGPGFGDDADPVTVGGTEITLTEELQRVGGDLTLDAFGFVTANAIFELEKTRVDVNVGAANFDTAAIDLAERDLDEAHLMTLFLQINDLFIGVPDSIGFQVDTGTLALATITPDPVLHPGDDRKWTAISASLEGASLAGLPDDLIIEATFLEIGINKVASATPGLPALDWTTQVGTFTQQGNNFTPEEVRVGPTSPEDLSIPILFTGELLSASGGLKLDAFGFVQATATFTFEKSRVDVDVDGDGNFNVNGNTGDMDNAVLVTLSLTLSEVFIGVPGDNPDSHDDDLGFVLAEGNLTFASIKADPLATPADDRSYTAISASLGGAALIGIDALTLRANFLGLQINQAKSATNPELAALNWATSVNLDNDSTNGQSFVGDEDVVTVGGLDIDFTADFLRVSADVVIDIGGFVHVSGAVVIERRKDIDVTLVGDTTTTKLSLLTIGASNVNVFAGVGAEIDDGGTPDVYDDDTLDLSGALGVSLTIEELAVALMKPLPTIAVPTPTKSYTALKGSGGAALVGLDVLTLEGTLNVEVNIASDTAQPGVKIPVVDFSMLPGGALTVPTSETTSVDLDFDERLIKATGFVTLTIDEFVHVSGGFAFEQGEDLNEVTLSDGTKLNSDGGAINKASILKIGASNVNAFAGVGGPFFVDSNEDGIIDENDTPESDGAMGIAFSNLEFALALIKELPDTGTQPSPTMKSFYALRASGDVEFVGIEGLTISARQLTAEINGSNDTATPKKVVDFIATFGEDGLRVTTGPGETDFIDLQYTNILLRVSGFVTVTISEFVHVSGSFAFEKGADVTNVQLSDGTTVATASVIKVGAANVNAFVGTGGPYFQDDSGPEGEPDGIIDDFDTLLEDGATGLVLRQLRFGLALIKPVVPQGQPAPTQSFFALEAEAAEIALVGVEGVTIQAESIKVSINGGSNSNPSAVTPAPVINFLATDWTGADPPNTGLFVSTQPDDPDPVELRFTSRLLRASGDITLAFDFDGDEIDDVSLGASIFFEQAFRANGSQITKVALTNVSLVLGDPDGEGGEPGIIDISGASGLIVLSDLGLAAKFSVPLARTLIFCRRR